MKLNNMGEIKQALIKIIKELLGAVVAEADFSVPPTLVQGDLALPCFQFAPAVGQTPVILARDWKNKLEKEPKIKKFIEKIEALGPYLNFFIKEDHLNKELLSAGREKKRLTISQKIMIEYSQPNTHKEFHVGHLRNACLGAALVNMQRWLGYKVIAANYIGDTGAHVAKCLWNLMKYHGGDTLPENKGQYLGGIYAEAVQKLEADETLGAEVSQIQKDLEAGQADIKKLWQETKKWSLESFYRIYDLLGIKFDVWFWESEEEKAGRKWLEQILRQQKIAEIKKSEGAIIADLRGYNLDVLVLIKSDGNVLYGAKDLPLAKKKFDKFKIDQSIYVVDNRQSLYLCQIFKLLDLLGYQGREKVHVPYDFVTLPEGAMASRKGNVVEFEKFYAQVLAKVIPETRQRHKDWSDVRVKFIAARIALAAIKFSLLKYDNNSVIVFDVNQALSLEGDTGPYLLYSLARLNSILARTPQEISGRVDYKLYETDAEKLLIRQIGSFQEIVERAASDYSAVKLSVYLLELAQKFNRFYHLCPVLQAPDEIKAARLWLIQRVKAILETGLHLLNIEPVEEM